MEQINRFLNEVVGHWFGVFVHMAQMGRVMARVLKGERTLIVGAAMIAGVLAACSPQPRTNPADGMLLIYIPAGTFIMGGGEAPEHEVTLSAYWIDQTPVTNAMYAECYAAGVCPEPVDADFNPDYYDPLLADHPMVYVTWGTAALYCQWSGGRLPTEAEWEKAARGTDGRKYPWGEDKPTRDRVNVNLFHAGTVSVGSYPAGASPYGVLDMGSNVREWVADWYAPAYLDPQTTNPTGPDTGLQRVLRGADWTDALKATIATHRFSHLPDSAGSGRGFRCVVAP